MPRRSRPYDPLDDVKDEQLPLAAAALRELLDYRSQQKLERLPGVNPTEERIRLSVILNHLIDKIAGGIEANPSKLWVMRHFQQALEAIGAEDSEAKEHFGYELQKIMKILRISKSDGLLAFYLSPTGQ